MFRIQVFLFVEMEKRTSNSWYNCSINQFQWNCLIGNYSKFEAICYRYTHTFWRKWTVSRTFTIHQQNHNNNTYLCYGFWCLLKTMTIIIIKPFHLSPFTTIYHHSQPDKGHIYNMYIVHIIWHEFIDNLIKYLLSVQQSGQQANKCNPLEAWTSNKPLHHLQICGKYLFWDEGERKTICILIVVGAVQFVFFLYFPGLFVCTIGI